MSCKTNTISNPKDVPPARATWAGLAVNLVFAEALALGNEIDSALNGNCK